ncbi:hypothetical protein [Stenotrophomonas maltophilia]|uniref:hypothetical protein n=1 Tax=Stenotrophomonas maltophilia TaxID=40324 RepID=UPI003875F73D
MDTAEATKSSNPFGKALIALAILIAATPGLAIANQIASDKSAIHERQLESSDGKKWIVRTIPSSDFNGGQVMVEQRLFRDGKGGLVYRFDDQSQATKTYHQALCEAKDSVPSRGATTISGEAVWSWSCTNSKAGAPSSSSTPISARSSDYLFAVAPDGNYPVGSNFTSSGAIAFKSVVAGDMKATLSIDDGRCTTSVSEPYSTPFEGSHVAQLACLISDARTVNTSMEGCIPQRCATGRGSLNPL